MKLLVTTDFSKNSKGAIRFVKTLAKQSKDIEVVFYHVVDFLKPNQWNDEYFISYKKDEIERLNVKLKKFILAIVKEEKDKFSSINFVIDSTYTVENNIIHYAEKNKFDYICMATQGAGILRKVIGTHTSYIVNNSKIPVLVIPSHYRSKSIKKITYLSDFENTKNEITKISKFYKSIKTDLNVLHYSSIVLDKTKFERTKNLFKTADYKDIKLNIVKNNLEYSLVERVAHYVEKSKPELLIMFTKREKSFFESIFLPSKSAKLTYSTKVPVLIYSK
ncbi:MAG: universal stress protein [Sphingobacteriaceae bacterium]|nr:universal stress protein [Sphingobacteriaceae bacterium]